MSFSARRGQEPNVFVTADGRELKACVIRSGIYTIAVAHRYIHSRWSFIGASEDVRLTWFRPVKFQVYYLGNYYIKIQAYNSRRRGSWIGERVDIDYAVYRGQRVIVDQNVHTYFARSYELAVAFKVYCNEHGHLLRAGTEWLEHWFGHNAVKFETTQTPDSAWLFEYAAFRDK